MGQKGELFTLQGIGAIVGLGKEGIGAMEHHSAVLEMVVIILGLMFVASMAALAARRMRFPFTILLVLAGLAMGWAKHSIPALHVLEAFKLTPDIVLFIFLPALLFESAFNLDARYLLKNIVPIATLAVPALLISTTVVGAIVHYALGLGWSVALLFGALISATDPVAVVALFKEMGAPKRLHLLVEGESLFNDGTALVVFKIILGIIVAGATISGATIASGVGQFLIVASGGIATGVMLGVVISKVIELVRNDRFVEITLTTILAHSTFITAEHVLHVSGVMATVAAGLTMGSYGRNKISPQVHVHMESFWEYFAFICNSLIFLLVGLSIDISLLTQNASAILWAAGAVLIARGIAVYSVFPFVERLRFVEPVSREFQTVVFWGGLRGALAIVMVLSIPDGLAFKPFLMVLTLGVVFFTLVANGLSVKPLMRLMGLDRYSLKERFEYAQAMLDVKRHTGERLVPFAREQAVFPERAKAHQTVYGKEVAALNQDLDTIRKKLGPGDETEVLLRHCLLLERRKYQRLFHDGLLSEDNLKDMQIAIERQLDRLKEGRGVYRPGKLPLMGRVIVALGKLPLIQPLARRYKTMRIGKRFEVERARFHVSTAVLGELKHMVHDMGASETAARSAEQLYTYLHKKAGERLEDIRREYPEYVEKVEERIVERYALNTELEGYRDLYRRGFISEKMMNEMAGRIEERLRRLKMRPVQELALTPRDLLARVPLFADLPDEDLLALTARLHARSFIMGENVVQQAEEGDSLFVIGRGQVDVIELEADGTERILTRLRAGDFFGETALQHPQPRTATVRAVTPCTLLELTRERLLPVLEHAPAVKEALEAAHQSRALSTLLAHMPRFQSLSNSKRDAVANQMRAISLSPGQSTESAHAGEFYVLGSGEAEVSVDGVREAELAAGDFFEAHGGEVIKAVTETQVYVLEKASY